MKWFCCAMVLFVLPIPTCAQTKIDKETQTKGVLPVSKGGTGTANPGLIPGTNISITGSWPNQTISAAGAVSLSPIAAQTILSFLPNQFNIFDVPFSSYSALAQSFADELAFFNETPITRIGRSNSSSTIWILNDRDGSDAVQNALYLTSFVTNDVNRPNSQQGTALSVQSRATGSGNFGFLASAAFNTQYRGSAVLSHAYGGWFAVPQNLGSGSIAKRND